MPTTPGRSSLTDTKKLRLASCGSLYPLHVHIGEVAKLKIDGYPLGVREDTTYDTIEAQLSEGDYLIGFRCAQDE